MRDLPLTSLVLAGIGAAYIGGQLYGAAAVLGVLGFALASADLVILLLPTTKEKN